MTTSSLRRQVKNIVHNYSEAEIKVREATSNDPWGPSSSLMSEIAELTLNAVAFSEVMGMIWRRLNDSGKNWRHVYKALTLLDYLIKTGSEKVAHQCRENMFTIQTLKDFQFLDRDGKDQGINVREKAKQIVGLLKDEERLKQERSHARKTKERMALGTSSSSYGRRPSHYGDDYTKSRGSPSSYNSTSSSSPQLSTDLEQARPQTSGEEELQLQLALAMSREEAEKKPVAPVSDMDEEHQLQFALSLSKEEHEKEVRSWQGENSLLQKALNENLSVAEEEEKEDQMKKNESSILDLVDIFGPAPVPSSQSSSDPWDIPGAGSGSGNAAHIWNNDNISSAPNMPLSTSWEPIKLKSNVTESAASWNCSLDPWGPSPDPWTAGPAVSKQASGDSLSRPVTPGKHASAESWDLPALPSTDPWGKMSSSPKPLRAEYADPWGEATEKSSETDDSTFDIFAKLPDQPEHVGSSGSQRPSSLKSESPVDLDLFGDPVPSTKQDDTFDLSGLGDSLSAAKDKTRCRTPESFLDPAASSLVNLDSLISKPNQGINSRNPFLSVLSAPSPTNPFQLGDQTKPTLNQMRTSSPVPCAVTGTTLNQIQTQTPGLGAVMGTGLNQLRTISPVPGLAMGTNLNQMRTISPVPGIAMETNMNSMTYSTSLPLPLSSISSMMGVPSSLSAFPQGQGVPFEQLPSSLPQPLLPVSSSVPPSSSQAGNNPFL